MTKFLFGDGRHSFNAIEVADIKFQRNGAAAKPAHLRLKRQQTSALAAGEHEIRPGLGEGARKILAEPPARPGNDGHPGTEIEEPVAHENTPGVRTTFIKLGSHACNRANHCGPSPRSEERRVGKECKTRE